YDREECYNEAKYDTVTSDFSLGELSEWVFESVEEIEELPLLLSSYLTIVKKYHTFRSEDSRHSIIQVYLICALECLGTCKMRLDENSSMSCVLQKAYEVVRYHGYADFVLGHSIFNKRFPDDAMLTIVEAKKEKDQNDAVAQLVAEMATSRSNRLLKGKKGVSFGILTNGEDWQFYKLDEQKEIFESNCLTATLDQRFNLKKVQAVLSAILYVLREAMSTTSLDFGTSQELDIDEEFASISINE
ncbi:hypothetical protein O9G_000887, partial [Rozella allomycis CSF55]